MTMYKGRIVSITKDTISGIYLKQGVKKPEQHKYENYPGGNGTYICGGEYFGTHLFVKIKVFDLNKTYSFDVYEDIKRIKGISRISAKLLATIKAHEGEEIDIEVDANDRAHFDLNILLQ